MRNWMLFAGVVAMISACSDDGGEPVDACPEGTVRVGDECQAVDGGAGDGGSMTDGGDMDAGTTDGGAATDGGSNTDGTSDGGGSGAVPFNVDDFYGPSGYFGEFCAIEAIACSERGGDETGLCHGFTWTPNGGPCEDSTEEGFAGVWWQNPDGNFGDEPGLELPGPVNGVRFYAWGEAGGETVEFLAGYPTDAASGTTGDVTLTTTPTEYTISFGELVTGTQAGGFGWVAANNEVTIYVDSIAYVDDLEVTEPDAGTDAGTDGGSGGEFTVSISDNFGPSGYFGEFCAITELTCPDGPQGGAGACIGYEWVPNGGPCEGSEEAGFAGVWWQNPDGNWGDQPGFAIPDGVTGVQFYAWGEAGGEVVEFSSGYATDPATGTTGQVTLTTSPTRYEIDFGGPVSGDFAGGFSWVAADNGVRFYVDTIEFVGGSSGGTDAGPGVDAGPGTDAGGGGDPGSGEGPSSLPVIVSDWFGPSGYMGETGAITDEACSDTTRPDSARGLCHRFTWTPSGGAGWAGVFWQYPDGNWGDLPGLTFPSGASTLRFYAWGRDGGEVVKFAGGYGDSDPVNAETADLTLSASPTQYEITFGGASIPSIAGGFAWFAGGADAPVVFYVDDIVWE